MNGTTIIIVIITINFIDITETLLVSIIVKCHLVSNMTIRMRGGDGLFSWNSEQGHLMIWLTFNY